MRDPAIASARRSLLLPLSLRDSNGATVPVGALADRLLEERVVLVAGPPGAGKSTLLASLVYDYALYALNLGEADLAQCVLCEERRLPVVVSGFRFRVAGSWLGSGFRAPGSEGQGGLGVPAVVIVDGPERPLTSEEKRGLTGWLEGVVRSGEDVRVVVALRESDLPGALVQRAGVWRLQPLEAAAAAALMEARLGEDAARLAGALAGWDLWDLTGGPRLLALLCDLASKTEWSSRGALLEALLRAVASGQWPVFGGQGEGGGGKGEGVPGESGPVARQAWSQVERAWQGKGGRLLDGLMHCGAVVPEPGGGGTWANPALRDYLAALGLVEGMAAGQALAPLMEGSLADWSRALSLAQELAGAKPVLLDYLLQQPTEEVPSLAVRCARDSGIEPLLVQRAALLGMWPGLVPLAREMTRAGLFREAKALAEQAIVQGGAAGGRADLEEVLAEARAGLGLPPVQGRGAGTGNLDGQNLVASFERERRALAAGEARDRWRGGQASLLEATVEWELLGAQMAMEAGRNAEARRRVARASRLALMPGQWRRCGDAYGRLGRPTLAAALWERAARAAAAEEVEGLVARSRLAEAAGRLEEGCRLMGQAVRVQGADPDLLVEEARLLQRAGAALLARAKLERCLWLRRDYPPALATMGELLLSAGKVQEGIGFLRRATDVAPHDPELWGRLAQRLIETGRAREGEEALRAALERQPARAEWLNRLGLLLLESRRQGEALELFEAALAQAPRHPVYRYNRAMAMAARVAEVPGAEGEVLAEFAALAARPRPSRFGRDGAAADLTPTPSLQGKGGDAGVELPREGMLWDAVAAEAHRQRGLIFDRRGEFARAAEEFQMAGALVPEQVDYRLLESLAWGRLEDPGRRMALLRQAAEMWPLDASVELRLGEALEEEGEVAEALMHYRRAGELDPGRGEIWLARGRAERLAGQLGAAHASLERGLGMLPRDARVRKEMGLVLEESGAAEEAYECYREAARMAVSDGSLWVCVGRLARRLDRTTDSLAALRTAAGLDRGAVEPHIELGLALAQQGRYEEALGELREALTGDTTRALAHYHLALLARRLGREEEAERHFSHARSPGLAEGAGRDDGEQRWSLPEMHRLLDVGEVAQARVLAERAASEVGVVGMGLGRIMAEVRERLGDRKGALAALMQVDAATPADLRWRALLLSGMGRYEEALETVRRAGRGQRWPALRRDQAAILAGLGEWQAAAALYDVALAEAADLPGDERAWWLMAAGDARRRLGDATGALERYDRGISFGGPQAALWRRCAEVQVDLGRVDEALVALEQATSLDPADHAAWFLMAEVFSRQGSRLEAMEAVTRACDARPGHPEYALMRGRLLGSLGRGEEAVRWLREAAQGLQDAPLAWSDLGWALLAEEELDEAEEWFKKGLALDPRAVPCLGGLAHVRQRQGRREEALDLARHAARLAETGPGIGVPERRLAAEALEACGGAPEALRLRRALARESGLDHDWFGLARAARACGQTEEARSALGEALQRQETAGGHRLMAAVLWDVGEPAEALGHLRRAVDLEPDDAAGWVELASLLVHEGHWEEAVQRWGSPTPEAVNREGGWRLAKELAVAQIHLGEVGQAKVFLEQGRRELRWPPATGGTGNGAHRGPEMLLAGWWALIGASEVDLDTIEALARAAVGGVASAEVLYIAGLARLAAGDHAEACDALAQCVAQAPASATYRLGYARGLASPLRPLSGKNEGRHDRGPSGSATLAREQLQALRGRGGREFRRRVAAEWLRVGETGAAAETLEAVAGETRAAADEVLWADALLRSGRYEEAATVLRNAASPPNPLSTSVETGNGTAREGDGLEEERRYMLARALLGSGDTQEAVGLLQEVTRQRPDRADALAELGRAWERMGRYELARRTYERALAVTPGLREVEDRLLALDAKEQLERVARAGRGVQRSWTPSVPPRQGGE